MASLKITGPAKMSGTIALQGAKNATMHEILMTLVALGRFTITNVPEISSVTNHLKLLESQGAKTTFDNHQFTVDTTAVTKPVRISKDLFFHTSGAIYAVPILTGRFGFCEVEFDFSRSDTGGDQIGRSFDRTIELYKQCGISTEKKQYGYFFQKISDKPFTLDTINHSWGKSQCWLLAALFRDGKNVIKNYAQEPEHKDYIAFLKMCGAKISIDGPDVIVRGNKKLHGANHEAMSDKNDLATWIFLAIATKSPITITNAKITKEDIFPLFSVLDFWGVKLELDAEKLKINLDYLDLKPIDLVASMYPQFHTDWQPLISSILSQIDGISTVFDAYQSNRMQHWKELEKMGAKFEFIKDEKYPEQNGNPRGVRIFGGTKLHGATVNALDIRSAAGLTIAACMARGETLIENAEQLSRGYENFEGRLRDLMVKASIT